ncbi:MAG: Hsp20/alpha crystallin family protein [Candidatus Omnitrophica bacterium]|nr:Hsp20/alpha crystallin family protein [Candidatus Omnitrophota bacterium]MDE2010177.1 Hsp20/alpha crystallin family protein [Candidatus Omnitrophota bacterium]MDE2215066.1 Hsp20/alpha crystallin family protein [Candidatus Omnitrophota bacterium]MDE2232217.1 Hsp20/alpha crystallin family protein [Candidatus Omnitrophota bacterium]
MRLTPFKTQSSDVFNKVFDDDFFFGLPVLPMTERQPGTGAFYPALDVIEEKDQYILKADLPGMKKEDIKVSVENGILTIEGERKSETEHKDKQVYRVERSYGRFVRSLNLGSTVDSNKIRAAYKDGVLQLNVPKSEDAKPKAIDIQVS